MSAFVLVHGAWHGGWCWQRLTPMLAARGHSVYAPTLTGLGDRAHLRACVSGLKTHVQDVVALVEAEDLSDVVLVGHSLGGIKLPAMAEPIADRLAMLVNVDGAVPEPGQAIKDVLPAGVWERSRELGIEAGDEGWAPAPAWDFGLDADDFEWVRARLTPDPIITWESPIAFTHEGAGRLPSHYVHCTEGLGDEEIETQSEKCRQLGWQYHPLRAVHDVMVAQPDLLARFLLQLPLVGADSTIA
jgi:pimeloyl-ACP methyl ester carboxylesterase